MEKIIVKWQSRNYFFKYLPKERIMELYKTNKYSIFCNYLKKFGVENIPLGKWVSKINDKTKKVIFFDSMLNSNAVATVKEKNPNIRIYLYFWNPINKNNKYLLENNQIDKFYTFDEKEAKKYNIHYNSQFYTENIKLKEKKIKQDIYFLGRDK